MRSPYQWLTEFNFKGFCNNFDFIIFIQMLQWNVLVSFLAVVMSTYLLCPFCLNHFWQILHIKIFWGFHEQFASVFSDVHCFQTFCHKHNTEMILPSHAQFWNAISKMNFVQTFCHKYYTENISQSHEQSLDVSVELHLFQTFYHSICSKHFITNIALKWFHIQMNSFQMRF